MLRGMELLGLIIALVFMGLCIGVGVALAPRALKLLSAATTGVPVSSVRSPRPASRPATPAGSRSPGGTGRHPDPNPFPGLDAEIRARVAAQTSTPPASSAPTPDGVPDQLPVRTKQYFLARSEVAFLAALEASLPGGYRVFPNVRLNDLFFITTRHPGQQKGAYARLRDKHVDFLVVALPEHRPVFAIELDGASHDNAQQQYRDAVKDVAFRSAGLPLIRLRAEVQYSPASLRTALSEHLSIGHAHA